MSPALRVLIDWSLQKKFAPELGDYPISARYRID